MFQIKHHFFPVIIIIISLDTPCLLYKFTNVPMLELHRARQQYCWLLRRYQHQTVMNNNVSTTTNSSSLSRRILPNGSPKVGDKRKAQRRHQKNIRNLNQYVVKCAVEEGKLFLSKTPEDECPGKTAGVCAKWHDRNGEFFKHWFCPECVKSGKFSNNAQINRHNKSGPHLQWYNEKLKLSILYFFSFVFV